MRRLLMSGALAGVATAVAFAAVHDLMISDIWFSLVPMMAAGGLCGMCLAWTYGLLFDAPSAGSWLMYNTLHVALLIALGAISVVIYDPIASIPALLAANEPPRELIDRAMPLTVGFTFVSAGIVAALWGRSLPKFASILLTSAVMIFLFGINVSVLGLVELSGEGTAVVWEFFGLIVMIMAGYGITFFLLERRTLHH